MNTKTIALQISHKIQFSFIINFIMTNNSQTNLCSFYKSPFAFYYIFIRQKYYKNEKEKNSFNFMRYKLFNFWLYLFSHKPIRSSNSYQEHCLSGREKRRNNLFPLLILIESFQDDGSGNLPRHLV